MPAELTTAGEELSRFQWALRSDLNLLLMCENIRAIGIEPGPADDPKSSRLTTALFTQTRSLQKHTRSVRL